MRTVPGSNLDAYQKRQRAKRIRRKNRREAIGLFGFIGFFLFMIAVKVAIIGFVLWLAYELVMHIVGG